jgi:hypothetical protein
MFQFVLHYQKMGKLTSENTAKSKPGREFLKLVINNRVAIDCCLENFKIHECSEMPSH